MKLLTSILVLMLLFITNSIIAQNTNITATVVNISSEKGKVGFALYNKDNFMRVPIQGKKGKIINGKSTVVFEKVPKGEYAVICYHDKNNNDMLDFNSNRMPLEDFGASNNVMAFAPPTFEGAKFKVEAENVFLEIKF